MKRKQLWLIALAMIVAGTGFQSCRDENNDDSLSYPTALVTVKPNTTNSSFTMQLNDSVVLLPANIKEAPFGSKEVRALVNYTLAEENTAHSGKMVNINWIDSVRTKNMAPTLGDKNTVTYGIDPLEVVNDWVSIAEDGYLTLRFRTRWGVGVRHLVNLVPTGDQKDPYQVTFFHNAQKDLYGRVGDGIVAFRLDRLPDTKGKTVWLTLKWNSYSGMKMAKFKYCTRKETYASHTHMAAMTAPVQTNRID